MILPPYLISTSNLAASSSGRDYHGISNIDEINFQIHNLDF